MWRISICFSEKHCKNKESMLNNINNRLFTTEEIKNELWNFNTHWFC